MAFASMFIPLLIAFFFVVIVIFGIIWLTGLAITIVSAIRRGRAKKAGTKPHKAGLITGITLMALPFLIVGGLRIYNATQPNSWAVATGCRDSLQSGIETGDPQLVYSAFSEYTKNKRGDNRLYNEIERMLDFIDEEAECTKAWNPSFYGTKYSDDGSIIEERFEGEMEYVLTDSGQEYKLRYFGFCRYNDNENRMGLEQVIVWCGNERVDVGINTR